MGNNLVLKLNKIIDDFISEDKDDFIEVPCSGHYRRGKTFYFQKVGEELVLSIAKEVLKANRELRETVSVKDVEDLIKELIFKYRDLDKRITTDIAKSEITDKLMEIPLNQKKVFHKIYGLNVSRNEPYEIGEFTFYNTFKHKKYLKKVIPKDLFEIEEFGIWEHETWVSANVKCRTQHKAQEIANDYFRQLQGVLRYFVSFLGEQYDIGIYNYRKWNIEDLFVFWEENQCASLSHGEGAIAAIDIDSLIAEFYGYALTPEDLIKNIGSMDSNEIKRRVAMAIELYGHAFYDYGKPVCFLESMMAIEALIQMNTQQLINQSIGAQICEYSAFILAKKVEDRIAVEKKLKYFYGIRSKLAHGASLEVKKEDYIEVMRYAQVLIFYFIVDEKLKCMTNSDQLREYIQILKYSECID